MSSLGKASMIGLLSTMVYLGCQTTSTPLSSQLISTLSNEYYIANLPRPEANRGQFIFSLDETEITFDDIHAEVVGHEKIELQYLGTNRFLLNHIPEGNVDIVIYGSVLSESLNAANEKEWTHKLHIKDIKIENAKRSLLTNLSINQQI